jgi:uncharacterized protein (TIGR00369 family)
VSPVDCLIEQVELAEQQRRAAFGQCLDQVLAIQSMLEKGFGSTTLEFKISFLRPIAPDTALITAEGKVISYGRRVGTAEGRVIDRDGRLLVHGTTTCLIFESL